MAEELSPHIQQLLFKVQEAFEEETRPFLIHFGEKEIHVETSQKDYKLKIKPHRNRREPLGEYIHRHLARYTRDLMEAESTPYLILPQEGSYERQLQYYLDQEELAQTTKNDSLAFEALAKIGEVIHPYIHRPKDMKALRKIILSKGRNSYSTLKAAQRARQLLQARGTKHMRKFQRITPWILHRIKEDDWKELLETATLLHSLDNLNSQELIFEGPEMLNDYSESPDLESSDDQQPDN